MLILSNSNFSSGFNASWPGTQPKHGFGFVFVRFVNRKFCSLDVTCNFLKMITISCFVVCYYSYTNSEINSATALAKFAIIKDVNEVCIISEVHIVSVSLFLGGGGGG